MPSFVSPAIAPGSLSSTAQPVLSVGSVQLRPWTGDDASAVVAAYQEPAIQRWHARSMTTEEADEWITAAGAAWAAETGASWAIDHDGALAGRMTLTFHLADGFATAAYWIRAHARGRGIAPQALGMATDWVFSVGMHRVELEHSTMNAASCRVASKVGFDAEGTRRESVLHADGWHDMHVHAKIHDVQAPGP
ncbi:GNAT family N-acetyltransferase [Brachybacterium sp. FME24]|uniref:GNAT family N-acetyltransferase n=1 Tax=Brachybacterium sp. FME24 TaxID=2742605 RepID=UPI002715199E|nr:GNAT family N-acetyltransferase [Brachybacterium sp. FME24]